MKKPIAIRPFFTRNNEWWQVAIAVVTRHRGWRLKDVPGHAGHIVDFDDGTSVYYESHWNAGWSGPKPLEKLITWGSQPGNCLRVYAFPLCQAAIDDIYRRSEEQRGQWAYPLHQLFQMARGRLFGRSISPSPDMPVCSEAVSRLWFPWVNVPALAGVKDHDYVAPIDLEVAVRSVGTLSWRHD